YLARRLPFADLVLETPRGLTACFARSLADLAVVFFALAFFAFFAASFGKPTEAIAFTEPAANLMSVNATPVSIPEYESEFGAVFGPHAVTFLVPGSGSLASPRFFDFCRSSKLSACTRPTLGW